MTQSYMEPRTPRPRRKPNTRGATAETPDSDPRANTSRPRTRRQARLEREAEEQQRTSEEREGTLDGYAREEPDDGASKPARPLLKTWDEIRKSSSHPAASSKRLSRGTSTMAEVWRIPFPAFPKNFPMTRDRDNEFILSGYR